jgi:hypothetical protein
MFKLTYVIAGLLVYTTVHAEEMTVKEALAVIESAREACEAKSQHSSDDKKAACAKYEEARERLGSMWFREAD